MTDSAKGRRGWIGRGGTALAAVLCCLSLSTNSKPDLPVAKVPPGFTVDYKSDTPVQVGLRAKKPHGVKACIHVTPDTGVGYSWTAMADSAADMVIQGMIRQEQETSTVGGITTEPAGQEGMEGGTLLYKKTTTLQIGTRCPPWVTYAGTWIGKSGGGVLVVAVSNVPNSKDSIKGLIAGMLK